MWMNAPRWKARKPSSQSTSRIATIASNIMYLPIGAPLSETHPEFCTRYMRVVIATSRETGCPAPGAAACAMVLSKPPRARPSRDRVRGIRSLWRWTASTTIRRPACVPSQDRDPRRRAVARLANC
jgi:hypothetical protein